MPIERILGAGAGYVDPKVRDNSKVTTVKDGESPAPDTEDEFIIEVRIPKPEALIFSNRMKTRYETLPIEPSFIPRIFEDGKKLK